MTGLAETPPPPPLKKKTPWIWTIHKNDPCEVKNRGIPRIRGSLACLKFMYHTGILV